MDFQKYGAWTVSPSGEIPNKDEFDVLAWVNHTDPPSKKSRETSHALPRPNWLALRYVGVGVFLYWFIYLANVNTVLLVFCGICVFQIATCIWCSVPSQKHFSNGDFQGKQYFVPWKFDMTLSLEEIVLCLQIFLIICKNIYRLLHFL